MGEVIRPLKLSLHPGLEKSRKLLSVELTKSGFKEHKSSRDVEQSTEWKL